MSAAVPTPSGSVRQRYVPGPEVDSFYHLRNCDLTGADCQGTACFVARNACSQRHPAGEPRVYCLGRCFEAPATGLSEARPRVEIRSREPVVLARLAAGGARSLDTYRNLGGYLALQRALRGDPDDILRAMDASGLRGRGGAGFPTGRKWLAGAHAPAVPKYVVANADEGDPGAYIDRFLLEDDPHALIEGMIIAARAIGASRGWIYLRHEYPLAKIVVERALEEARAAGILGADVIGSGFSFDLEVFVGHGSYVCGEEMALLRSLEGQRPEVTARPPYPTVRGLFGRPTVTNNVETFASVPWIVQHGADAYRAMGFSQSRGTKVVSLNSLFERPGLYEVEFGASVRHIVKDLGGGLMDRDLKGVIIGGPLAGIVPPHLLDTPFGFEELAEIGAGVGHGGIVAFDHRTTIADLVKHVFSFGAFESCGKCTPCRLGSGRVLELFDRLASRAPSPRGRGHEWRGIVQALKWTSLCGHGSGLGAFAESVIRYYGPELESWFT